MRTIQKVSVSRTRVTGTPKALSNPGTSQRLFLTLNSLSKETRTQPLAASASTHFGLSSKKATTFSYSSRGKVFPAESMTREVFSKAITPSTS
ncbi:MAG: hypothetical protein QW650_00215 [Thermofilum sp.]